MNKKNKFFIVALSISTIVLTLGLSYSLFNTDSLKVLGNSDKTCYTITYDTRFCNLEAGCIPGNTQKTWDNNGTRTCYGTRPTTTKTRSCSNSSTTYTNSSEKNCSVLQKDTVKPVGTIK